jgi:hypothetical protein
MNPILKSFLIAVGIILSLILFVAIILLVPFGSLILGFLAIWGLVYAILTGRV